MSKTLCVWKCEKSLIAHKDTNPPPNFVPISERFPDELRCSDTDVFSAIDNFFNFYLVVLFQRDVNLHPERRRERNWNIISIWREWIIPNDSVDLFAETFTKVKKSLLWPTISKHFASFASGYSSAFRVEYPYKIIYIILNKLIILGRQGSYRKEKQPHILYVNRANSTVSNNFE